MRLKLHDIPKGLFHVSNCPKVLLEENFLLFSNFLGLELSNDFDLPELLEESSILPSVLPRIFDRFSLSNQTVSVCSKRGTDYRTC